MNDYTDEANIHIRQHVNWVMDLAWNDNNSQWDEYITVFNQYTYDNKKTGQVLTHDQYSDALNTKKITYPERNNWHQKWHYIAMYFLVSDCFGEYLISKGETVFYTPLGTVWGKTDLITCFEMHPIFRSFAKDVLGIKENDSN